VVFEFRLSLWICDQLCVDPQGVSRCLLFSSARLASRRGGLASSLNILQVLRLLQNAAQACNL
jgi:hypothetical protein